jgi:hypothetical protein
LESTEVKNSEEFTILINEGRELNSTLEKKEEKKYK